MNMPYAILKGFRVKADKHVLDEIVESKGQFYVNGRRVETGVFSQNYEHDFNARPDSNFSPETVVKKAVTSILKKNPRLAEKVNGFVNDVQRNRVGDGTITRRDWVYQGDEYLTTITFCKYKFKTRNSKAL